MFGQPLLVRTVPPRPTEQGQKLLALLRQVELLEEEWLGDEQTGSTPLLLSLAVNAASLATWLLPALATLGGPLAYLFGERLGAITFLDPTFIVVSWMIPGWLVLMLFFHLLMGRQQ